MKIAWVTDSTAHLDESLQKREDVYVIPMTIILDDIAYQEGIDINTEQLFEKLPLLKNPPTSSQPSIGKFKELYDSLEEDYDVIFSIHLSSHLSGTCNSAFQASQMVRIPVIVIDSKIISYPQAFIMKKGIEFAESGMPIQDIKNNIEKLIKANEAYVMVGSLEQLHRGGRMNGLQFFIGNLMNIKPIISIEDGALKIKEKVRSLKKGLEKISSYLENALHQNPIQEVFILYGLHDKEAQICREKLLAKFPHIKFKLFPLGSVIGIHAGEKTLGISWFSISD